MKKVSELEGAELDCWVAKAEGRVARLDRKVVVDVGGWPIERGAYSTDWSDGGPIIELENINLEKKRDEWLATIYKGSGYSRTAKGPTALVAAMRCYVMSKLGEEVLET